MVFSSPVFLWLFLPLCCGLNLCCGRHLKLSNAVLLIFSLFFYAWGEPVHVLLMLACIVISWAAGRGILALKDARPGAARLVLALGILADLAALFHYKYAGFAASLVNRALGTALPVSEAALPIGISFFTFQAISYLADLWRGDAEGRPTLTETALYISFFPQLIAGPIVQYRDISAQLCDRHITREGFALGFRRFIIGLGKKVLIANAVGQGADKLFPMDFANLNTGLCWLGAVLYTLQIYYDFSGYSDMAIGLGRMFGFTIPENFDLPYLSRSVTEFWRRWHISLGSWFRQYVYIPLGGNRKGFARTCVNLAVVFLLTGVWHGAGWTYIAWGAMFAVLSVAERLGLKRLLDRHALLSRVYLLLVVTLGWVIFRSDTLPRAIAFIKRMLMPWAYWTNAGATWQPTLRMTIITVLGILGAGPLQRLIPEKGMARWRHSLPEACALLLVLILCMAALAADTYNPFIYFQF